MALYTYKATTLEGAVSEGVIEAPDEKSAVDRLKNSGVIPLRIFPPKQGWRERLHFRSFKADVLAFTTELSALLGAGLPLDRSLNILSEISGSRDMNRIIRATLKSIREGSSFSEALRKHPRVFSDLYVNMIRAGEAGGVLDVVLEKLNEFLESAKELKDNIVSAMIYPALLLLTGTASIIVLFVFVLPRFAVIFSEMGTSLPLPSQIIIAVSHFLASYWWIILLVLSAGIILLRNYIKTDEGRLRWDTFKLRLLGDIILKLETARFTRTLGTLLKSGVPLLQALNNSGNIISNRAVAQSIDNVLKDAKEGKGIAMPLVRSSAFPPLALSMIQVGEETGQLDTMLLKVAATYEKSLRNTLKRFLSFLEPAMILFMALIIGFVVISMLMAVFSITDLPF